MLALMLVFTVGVSGVLIGRLFDIQVVRGMEYQREAINQQMSSLPISAERGEIKDRNGKTLAVSTTVWDVVADPSQIRDEPDRNGVVELEVIARGLSEILEMDIEDVRERCSREKTRHVYIAKRVEKPVQTELTKFLTENKIGGGISLVENTKRYYPYGTLASTVLGFVNDEGIGGTGLESQYNKVLSGTPGVVVSAKTALNTDMPVRYNTQLHEADNGKTLVLTIDETIQHYLEKHLETAVMENKVKNRAVAIAMNPKTGEVLAMATKPDFNPNNFKTIYDGSMQDEIPVTEGEGENARRRETATDRLAQIAADSGGTDNDTYRAAFASEQNLQWRNKCISDPYEPGSVFKLVTAAAALDTGKVTTDNYYTCYGSIEVLGQKYGCWKTAGHGSQSFAESIKHSCNPAFVRIGQTLQGGPFYDYFDSFGLTQGTGIDLPGEAASIYHSKDDMESSLISLSSSSFGQTFKVTPIQMLTAVCAVVNGGQLVTPYVVKQVLDDQNNVVSSNETQVRRQVISKETSETMCKIMESVVTDSDGSGRSSYIAGYRVGGKTGTSQKTDQRPEPGKAEEYCLSFAGVAPMDDPQIAVLVMMDAPSVSNIMGSTAAAPVVKYILDDVLPYMGIEPKYTAEEQSNRDIPAPNVTGKAIETAARLLEEQEFKIKVIGEGETVLKQVPSPSSPVPREATIICYTDSNLTPNKVPVPDVIGMGTAIINERIVGAGFNLSLTGATGSGCVASRQTPEAGTLREVGSVITVDLVATNVEGIATIG